MYDVVGVSFNKSNRIYYFSPNNIELTKNLNVIVETERGIQFGTVVTDLLKIEEKKLYLPLKTIVRIASEEDLFKYEDNKIKALEALETAKETAKKLELKMNLMDASYTLDRTQLVFNFLADERVDFRELAKKLAGIYKTRIELRQIGVRDKAKEIGGIGPCGRFLCCSVFLKDFNGVSINMAKNQNLSLNPTKINGICGRLLCCLKYEDQEYSDMKKELPSLGSTYRKDDIEGKVITQNILKGTVIIEKKDKTTMEISFNESNK